MEIHLGRYLEEHETVHHKDEDINNNEIDNLEIITRSKHAFMHAKKPDLQNVTFTCPTCKKRFKLSQERLKYFNSRRNANMNLDPFVQEDV